MEDLVNYEFAPFEPKTDPPLEEEVKFEEEDVLVEALMQAIDAPPLLTIDMMTKVIGLLANRQETRQSLSNYVDLITARPELSYKEIRLELQNFANSCVPPLTHMQARALAFVEKRRRAGEGDVAANANINNQPRYRWRLSDKVEGHLWRWIANRWSAKKEPQSERKSLLQELVMLSNNLATPQADIELWIRTAMAAIVKMKHGGVKITGLPVSVVVMAAIDDTAPC